MKNINRIKALIRATWGDEAVEQILAAAQAIDPTMTRVRLGNLAQRMRERGEIEDTQAYRQRTSTHKWTKHEERQLARMAGRYRVQEIAEHFGVSEAAVRKRASKLAVSLAFEREPPTPLNSTEVALARRVLLETAAANIRPGRLAYAVQRLANQEAAVA